MSTIQCNLFKFLWFITLSFLAGELSAQTYVQYSYDLSGNCTGRSVSQLLTSQPRQENVIDTVSVVKDSLTRAVNRPVFRGVEDDVCAKKSELLTMRKPKDFPLFVKWYFGDKRYISEHCGAFPGRI